MPLSGGKTPLGGGKTPLGGGKVSLGGGKTLLGGGTPRLAGGTLPLCTESSSLWRDKIAPADGSRWKPSALLPPRSRARWCRPRHRPPAGRRACRWRRPPGVPALLPLSSTTPVKMSGQPGRGDPIDVLRSPLLRLLMRPISRRISLQAQNRRSRKLQNPNRITPLARVSERAYRPPSRRITFRAPSLRTLIRLRPPAAGEPTPAPSAGYHAEGGPSRGRKS
jgi:hypothetical protein